MRLVSLLILTASTIAIPLESPLTEPVTQDLIDRLRLYAHHCAASYCKTNNNSTGGFLTCAINATSENSCYTLHQNPLIETLWEFENIEPGDTTGFLAADHERKELVLAVRGSQSKSNWNTNKKFTLTDWKGVCEECEVHRGFLEAYEAVKAQVIAALVKATGKYPEYQLVVTGHSLGGAMATVIATSLREEKAWKDVAKDPVLYTYGAPRVGNPALIAKIEAPPNKNYRVTKGSDPVPHVPLDFGTAWHFKQYFPEYHITHDHLNETVEVAHIQVCTKICDGKWDPNKWEPHGWYLTKKRMSACNVGQTDDSKGDIVPMRALNLLTVEEEEVREAALLDLRKLEEMRQ